MAIVRIPKRFFDDHAERELPTPPIESETVRHYFVSDMAEGFADLLDDAKYYADQWGPDAAPEIRRAAKAFLKALSSGGK